MSFSKKMSLCFTLLLLHMFFAINSSPAQTAEQIAEKALAATVYLEMKDSSGTVLGFGSGFFVKPNLIATNYHVIEGAASGTAKLIGKYTKYTIEGVTATDKKNDLTLLKVTAFGIKPLSLGDNELVKIGAKVYVAGNPIGLEGTFSDGIISSRHDKYTKERLQMTALISPGSNGGPVLNRKGQVIGVSFMNVDGGEKLNLAIPSKYVRDLLAKSKLSIPLPQGDKSISAKTYFLWGCVKDALGNYKGAVAEYSKAIQLKPDYAKAYHNRGYTKDALKQFEDAIQDYNKALQIKPDYALAYASRGAAKGALGQHKSAIADFDVAIRLMPDFPLAYGARGSSKHALGYHEAAIRDYDTAIRMTPNYALGYASRGAIKYRIGRLREAKENFKTALKLAEQSGDRHLKNTMELILQKIQ